MILFVDELKYCDSDMQIKLQLLVPVFLCLFSIFGCYVIF